jgi:hypothetical protein
MAESVDTLMREFLTWVSDRRRTYDEAMEAWQSHCPRQTIWEDAMIEGLIRIVPQASADDPEVTLTERGRSFLNGRDHD